jgi:hypothetical protein
MNMDQSLVFYSLDFHWPYLMPLLPRSAYQNNVFTQYDMPLRHILFFCAWPISIPWENYLVGGTGYSTLQVCINGTISSFYCTYEAAYTAISSMFDFRSFFNFTILSTSCTVILYTYACIGYLFCTCHFVPFQLFIIFK